MSKPTAFEAVSATMGAVGEETIKKCIESQHWGEDAEGFKITAPTKPEPALQPGTSDTVFLEELPGSRCGTH